MPSSARLRLLPGLVLGSLLAASYGSTFVWMVDRWEAEGSYYSHGMMIAPIALGWAWLRRDRLAAARVEPTAIGFWIFAAGLALHAASVSVSVHFTSGLSIVPVAIGLVLFLRGRETLRVLLAPILFLVFMVPIPLMLVAHLTLRLKLFAASAGIGAIQWLGIPAEQEGSLVHVAGESLMVGDACSGLRSLIALLALGFLVVQRVPGGWFAKTFVYACVLPLAVLGNVVRVFMLCLVATWVGAENIGGLIHDATGFAIYAITLAGLFTLVRAGERVAAWREVPA